MLSYLRKKMKSIMITIAVLFAASMFYGLGYTGLKNIKEGPQKGSIATINGKEIDHERLQQAFNRMIAQEKGRIKPEQAMMYQTAALEQVMDYMLMLGDAKKKFRASGREVDQAIEQIMQANKVPSKSALESALKNMGQTLSGFKKMIKEEIIVSKMANRIKGEVTVTPNDLREVKASHILILSRGSDAKSDFEARAKAEDILQRIKKGENFAALALKYSEDPGSAKMGGELGYFPTGKMVPEFENAAFSLKPGEVSDVIKTSYGYHIIKVEDTKLRKVKEKGKDLNEQVLAEKQDMAYRRWIFGLRQKANIEINDPIIKAYSMLIAGNLNEAISSFNQAAMSNPYNPYIHLFLGQAYKQAGNTEFAMLEYKKAGEFSGADPGLLIAVGDAYSDIKNRTLALEQYRKASLIAGDNKDIHKELKDIYKKYGTKSDVSKEQAEINRIEKKEKFEKEIQEKMK